MTKKIIASLALSLSSFFSHAQDCFTLVWSDEFNGTSIDETKWNFENGTGYPVLTDWGNGEVQYYSNRPENIEVSNGSLKINAVQENFGGKSYSSGRIRSKGNFDFKYGRIEARIKIPKGSGLWPAFWLLPSENVFGGWPYSGEIDIMENFGQDDYIGSTIHYKDGSNNNQWNSQSYGTTHDEYHTFSAVWDQNIISFYSDWNWIGDEKPADLKGGTWPFNENFYLILNLALGGNAGSINGTTFPKTMEVDYVRVYQKTSHIAIQGPTQVYPNQTVSYTLPTNATATYNWTAPSGATILSGQGTNKVTLKWGTAAGNVLCSTSNWSGDIAGQNNTCAAAQHTKAVTILTKNCDIPLLNFDGVQKLVPSTADGVGGMESMYEKNISKTTINTSPLVGRFARVGGQQYDVLKLNFTEAVDVSNLRSELNKFKMDVYATSGTSIPVTIELVNRAKNTGYPNGIHSQLTATISSSNSWQTLNFKYTNTPDWSIMGDQIDGINILFNSGSNTTSTYYFDNLRTELPIAYVISGPSEVKDPEIANIQNYSIPNETGSSYAWTVGDKTVISSGQNTNALNVKFNNGMYSNTLEVTQTNSMLCEYSTSKVVAVDGLTAISSEAIDNSIQVFPNPMANELSIQTDLGTISEYKLLDAHGLLIVQGQVDKSARINTDALTAGIYFLNISNTAINQTYKVIKK